MRVLVLELVLGLGLGVLVLVLVLMLVLVLVVLVGLCLSYLFSMDTLVWHVQDSVSGAILVLSQIVVLPVK